MKKSLLAASLLLATAPSAQADTFLGIYAAAQAWNMDTEGGFANSSSLTNFNFDDKTKGNFYVAFEHFVPFVPNVKVARTDLNTAGNVVLQSSFGFGGRLFATNSSLNTDIEISNTDIILYYELFDNDLVSFDLGINAKYIDGTLFVQDATDPSKKVSQDFSGPVPTLYSRLAVGIPGTGIGLFAEGSMLSVNDHTLRDVQVAVTYDLVENPAVNVDLQVGYRSVLLELEDLDNIYSNLEFKGAFAGIEVHF